MTTKTAPVETAPATGASMIHRAQSEDNRLTFAVAATLVAGVAGAILGIVVTAGSPEVTLAGASSLLSAIVPLMIVVVVIVGLIGYRAAFAARVDVNAVERQVLEERRGVLTWIGRISFALSLGMLAYLALLLVSKYIEYALVGTTIFRFSAIMAATLSSAMIAYVAGDWVTGMTHRDILPVTAFMVNGGLIVSMLLVQNPRWWTESLSYMATIRIHRWCST